MFPETVLGNKVELYYDGRWNRVPSGDVRGLGAADGEIKIGQRGQPDESSGLVVTSADLSLNNRDGKYSPRNTASELYGKIGLNTPLRISTDLSSTADVEEATITHTHNAVNTEQAYTVSTVVTDIDATVDGVALEAAPTGANVEVTIRSRISNSGNDFVQGRIVFTTAGTVQVGTEYSASGTVTSSSLSTVAGLAATDIVAVRFQTVGRALRVRAWESGTTEPSTWDVSEETDSVLTPGSIAITSILDTGNTNVAPYDIVFTDVFLSLGVILFVGEVAEWPKRWDLTGTDVWVPLRANGITRRLLQGNVTAGSALKRALSRLDLIGYWSVEGMIGDALSQPVIVSDLDDGNPLVRINNVAFNDATVDWSGASDLTGSDSLPTVELSTGGSASIDYRDAKFTPPDSTHNQFSWCVWMRSNLSGDALNIAGYLSLYFTTLNGTFGQWNCSIYMEDVAGVKNIDMSVFADSGALFNEFVTTSYVNDWHFFRFTVDQPAANQLRLRTYMDEVLLGTELEAAGVPNVGQPFEIGYLIINVDSDDQYISFGHLAFASGVGTDPIQANAADIYAAGYQGNAGETAVERMTRLCAEEGINFAVTTATDELGTPMGPQENKSFVDLMEECALADDGVLFELRETFGYGYRSRASLYGAPSRLTLDYSNSDLSAVPEATDDDQLIVNRFTAKRKGAQGSGVTVVQSTGAMSTADPYDDPPGVGLYPDGEDVNVYDDDQLLDYAGWRVHVGTWDEDRWPGISVLLERSPLTNDLPKLAAAVFLDVAEIMTITNTPAWLGGGSLLLQMRSVSVFLSNFSWGIDWATLPGGPWVEVATVDSVSYGRLDTSGSEIVSAVDTDDTALLVYTPEVDLPWSTALWTEDLGELNYSGADGIDFRLNPASRVGGRGGEQVRAAVELTAEDAFTRSGALTGSTADAGGTWSYLAGTATAATTDGSRAVFTHPSANTSMFMTLNAGSPDVCATVDIAFSMSTTGGADFTARLALRLTDASNYYAAVLTLPSSGSSSARLSVVKVVAGSQTTLSSTLFTVDIANTATEYIRVKAMIRNRDIYAKAWHAADGDEAEPDWQISLPEAARDLLTGNSIGLRTLRSTGNTTADATAYFDNLKVHVPKVEPAYYDRFTRTVSNGLGTADRGGSWTTLSTGGVVAASDFNVASPAATTILKAAGDVRGGYLADISLTDVCVSRVWSIPALPTGSNLNPGDVLLRGTSSTSYITCRVGVTTTTFNFGLTVSIVAADGTTLASKSLTYITVTTGTQFRTKAAADGTQIMLKVWEASKVEPDHWQLIAEDTTADPVAGWVGFRNERAIGNTNVNPTPSTYDFRVENPQRIEVTRGVNNINKSWSAGNDIRLWNPAILGR